MPDHVRVGVIGDNQVIPRRNRADKGIRHLCRRHLGLQIIGGDLGRRGHIAHLAHFGRFLAAVQEKRDMRVFFGLGQMKLGQAMFGHPGAQRIDQIAFGKHRPEPGGMLRGIFHHPQLGNQRHRIATLKGGKARIGDCRQNLAAAVGAKVQA